MVSTTLRASRYLRRAGRAAILTTFSTAGARIEILSATAMPPNYGRHTLRASGYGLIAYLPRVRHGPFSSLIEEEERQRVEHLGDRRLGEEVAAGEHAECGVGV